MCAQELLRTRRSQLVSALAGGSVENFESVLDYLLSWEVLTWEDYEDVSIRGHGVSRLSRALLDILWTKGDQGYELLIAALEEVGKRHQSTGLELVNVEFQEPSICLRKHRPLIVRKIHGQVEGMLKHLLDANFISKYECDEVQLPIYTRSQQARRLLDVVKAKGNEAARCLLQCIQGVEEKTTILPDGETCMKYQRKLKSIVSAQSRFLNTYDGAENMCLEDVYTESVLELVKNIGVLGRTHSSNNFIGIVNLFDANGCINKDADTILIVGEAGCGKTTLLQQMHHTWATGKAFHKFSFIFPFSCRQLCCIQKPVSLRTLLFEHCCWPDFDQEEIFQYILNNPQEILLTFDGFDEFKFRFTDEEKHCSSTEPASIHSILCNLVQGNLMKGALKVVTSRPAAISASFRKYIQKEVCVKGFSEGEIELFIKRNHGDLKVSQSIIDLLNTNPSLHGLCHVPVFCWIVSRCHKELIRSGGFSPQTMTDVYLLTLRHFLMHNVPAKDRTQNVLCAKANTIHHLGRLALSGLGNCCYVFNTHQLKEAEVSEEDISSGFFVLSRNLSKDPLSLNQHYEFVHITFQCFFVALYLAINDQLSSMVMHCFFAHTRKKVHASSFRTCSLMCFKPADVEERTTVAMLHQAEHSNLQMTANFLAGLLSNRLCDLLVESWKPEKLPKKKKFFKRLLAESIQNHFKSIPPAVHGEKKSMHAMPEFVWLINCIHEMQDSHLAADAVNDFDVEHLKLTYCGIGPPECTALAFVLKFLKNPISLQLDHNSIGDIGIEQLCPCLNLCQALYLRDNKISDKGIARLLDQALHWQNFQKLALFNNQLTDACAHSFANLLKQKHNFTALRMPLLHSEGCSDFKVPEKCRMLLQDISSMPKIDEFPLDSFLLGNNYITSEGAEVLADGVKQSKSLQFLGSLAYFAQFEDSGRQLTKEVNAYQFSFTQLMEVHRGRTPEPRNLTLSGEPSRLWGNSVGNNGAQALAEALHDNKSLIWLSLVGNSIGSIGAQALAFMVGTNPALEELCLEENHLEDEDAHAFAEALKINSNLKVLKLSNNFITKHGVSALHNALDHNNSITSIWLRGNSLSSEETETFSSLNTRLLF